MRRRRALGSTVAITTVIGLAACTGGGDGPGSRSPGRTGDAGHGPAVSPAEYRRTLEASSGPLNSALSTLADAKSHKALGQGVTAVEQATAQAFTRLAQVNPPAAVSAEHTRLVSAVQRLGRDTEALSADVRTRRLCTTPAARGRLGRSPGARAVRDAVRALQAKAPGYRVALDLPAAGRERTRRPPNGRFVRSGDRNARGSITIENGGDTDTVITLAQGTRAVYSVYVRKDDKYTVTGVRDGGYQVFYTSGTDWDPGARAFTRGCTFERFEESLRFRTVRTATQIRWSTWRITLQPVAGGTARTRDVPPEDFPGS